MVLVALRMGASYAKAAMASGLSRSALYYWMGEDEDFQAACKEAEEEGTDRLEDEMLRRAVDGTDKPVFHQGSVVGTVREYSDTLAIFLAKARRPDKFKDRAAVEHSGTVNFAEALDAAAARLKKFNDDGPA